MISPILTQLLLAVCLFNTILAVPAEKSADPRLGKLSSACSGPWSSSKSKIVCINRYASLMPIPFTRQESHTFANLETFGSTSIQGDPSFSLVSEADFLIFDQEKAFEVLGASASIKEIFKVDDVMHEAPVFVPDVNKLYVAPIGTNVTQLEIDLSADPPTISNISADPPIKNINGGGYYKGLVYYVTDAGTETAPPGIYQFNPKTYKSAPVANNYYGYQFNGPDDLTIGLNGDIWFTDPGYGNTAPTDAAFPLQISSYRYSASTGEISLVDDSLHLPNGIAISPDQSTIYISDTAADPNVSPNLYSPTGPRTVYAFDVASRSKLNNKSSIYRAIEGIPDGLKVARNGFIVTCTGHGVDILDKDGSLVVRIQTGFPAINIDWTGKDRETMWIVGTGGISRVDWALKGQKLVTK